jgi:cobalamin biosynthesis protein CobC
MAAAMARYGGGRQDWIDLSTGINPWSFPMRDLDLASWVRLPQHDRLEALLSAARTAYGAGEDAAIVAAPGTQALIQALPTLLSPRRVAVVGPTYGEYAPAWRAAGHDVEEVSAPTRDTDVLVACSPNNPDGRLLERSLAEQAGDDLLLVVDEAFGDVAPGASIAGEAGRPGLLVLRSFGKFFGLAGLRLGFALGERALIERLAARLGPWAVSGPAIEVGIAALRDRGWQEATRNRLRVAALQLDNVLAERGLRVIGGTDLFRLAKTAGPARDLHAHLARCHIWTRPFANRPRWLRFGLPGPEEDWRRLERALTCAPHRPRSEGR